MKFNYLSVVILVFSITLQAQNLKLINAIQESDVEKVTQNLNKLSEKEKASLLDLAQTIINKKRDHRYFFLIPGLFGSLLGFQLFYQGFYVCADQIKKKILTFNKGFSTKSNAMISSWNTCATNTNGFLPLSISTVMLTTVFLIYKKLTKQYDDAVAIKQLIYNC